MLGKNMSSIYTFKAFKKLKNKKRGRGTGASNPNHLPRPLDKLQPMGVMSQTWWNDAPGCPLTEPTHTSAPLFLFQPLHKKTRIKLLNIYNYHTVRLRGYYSRDNTYFNWLLNFKTYKNELNDTNGKQLNKSASTNIPKTKGMHKMQ